MAYHYENLKLEKGMYGRGGKTFSQTLEELDRARQAGVNGKST